MTFVKKKSLGQNFLRSTAALNKIVAAAEIKIGETVLEIGPGEGNLTKELLAKGAHVVAVEKDDRLIPILEQKFSTEISAGRLRLIHSDILNFFPSAYGLEPSAYSLVANIPYYITGEILRKALSEWPQPESAVLLVQKEVAERIVARDGKAIPVDHPDWSPDRQRRFRESLLSISVKIYGDPKITGIVKAGSFVPAPKVDSAILKIENISKTRLGNIDEKRFFEIARAGFAHKRKILSGNLKPVFLEDTGHRFTACGIQKTARAENLTIKNWLCLSANLLN